MRAYFGFLVSGMFCAGGAFAAGLPAELPPDGYIGRAFVDSQGCAFSRAEVNDAVVWIARLDASREQVCDEVPTFATTEGRVMVTTPVAVSVVQSVPARRQAATVVPVAEHGFRPAWTDGRHNPNRGPQTAEGNADMLRVWSNDVPMVRR